MLDKYFISSLNTTHGLNIQTPEVTPPLSRCFAGGFPACSNLKVLTGTKCDDVAFSSAPPNLENLWVVVECVRMRTFSLI